MGRKIRCSMENQGFSGYYFQGSKGKDKAVIYLGGAACNEKFGIESSAFLRDAGYSVLVLGFYFWKGMSKKMYNIPVEYAQRAAKWLHKIGYREVIIMGTSTGAGYAMLCASLVSDINGAVLISPFDHIMEAADYNLITRKHSVYQYRNKSMPFAHYTVFDEGYIRGILKFLRQKDYDLGHFMRYAYDTADYNEDNRIKVERIRGSILLIAPRVDDCWPSTEAVIRMEQILQDEKFPYTHQMIIYEKGSHALGYLRFDRILEMILKFTCPMEKRYPKACRKAREDSTRDILSFLEKI